MDSTRQTEQASMVQYLDKSESMKVVIEELEHCLLGHMVANARGKKRRRHFQIFSVQGHSDFLVVGAARGTSIRGCTRDRRKSAKVIKYLSERQCEICL